MFNNLAFRLPHSKSKSIAYPVGCNLTHQTLLWPVVVFIDQHVQEGFFRVHVTLDQGQNFFLRPIGDVWRPSRIDIGPDAAPAWTLCRRVEARDRAAVPSLTSRRYARSSRKVNDCFRRQGCRPDV